jgi:hypothetical protein
MFEYVMFAAVTHDPAFSEKPRGNLLAVRLRLLHWGTSVMRKYWRTQASPSKGLMTNPCRFDPSITAASCAKRKGCANLNGPRQSSCNHGQRKIDPGSFADLEPQ